MHIEKLNENQIEIIINLEDLTKNNISLHSFMCNSVESQNMFYNILNYADKKIGFSLVNYKLVTEIFSIPSKNYYILLITRVPKTPYLHPRKKVTSKYKFSKSFWIEFNTLEEFCMFCNFLKSTISSSLFLHNNHYFLHIYAKNIKQYFKLFNAAFEFSKKIYSHNFILDENAKSIIKNCAIQTAQKYFI